MNQADTQNKYKNKIITIPNILSFVRLCLIPLIVMVYLKERYFLTGILVIFSGLTDIIDGTIARKYNMISDVRKVLDPVADKSTQGAVMILLATSFPLMILPICLTIVKELFMAISGYMVIRKCGIVLGADWHGKAATVGLTITMCLHLVWHGIFPGLSIALICLSSALILLSLILYAKRNFGYLLGKNKAE
jgi:cardiolipin synthase